MNLQALQRKVKGDETYTELAEIALHQAARLEQMLSDLLGYGKPLELNISPVRFERLASDVVEMVRKDREEKNVTIEIRDRLRARGILADPEQLRRALTNLLTNAVQSVPPSGKVILSGGVRPGDPEMAEIAVADNGPGIPEAHSDKLFQPFFTAREGGTGLGLANVKKIVDLHGGEVGAGNRPEGGAVFTMTFKLGEQPV
jgi:signal transduction histidine kinase